MTLTRSSILRYWSARYGTLPLGFGDPVHSRNSAASWSDNSGMVRSAIINTPRLSWEIDKSTTANERRAALLLEAAGTNTVPFSLDLSNAAWTKSGTSIAVSIRDPKGGTTAVTVTATAANGFVNQSLGTSTSAQRANAIWIRRRTGTGTVGILRSDGSAYDAVVPTTTWQRLSALLNVANTSRWHGLQLGTSGDAVDVWNAQQENATFSSSDIVNPAGGTTSRSADSFYWNDDQPIQARAIFTRHIERGTAQMGLGTRLWQFSDAANSNPLWTVYANAGGSYTVQHSTSVGTVTAALAVVPALGDTVELVALLFATGAVQLLISINGGAVGNTAVSGVQAFNATYFSGNRLYLNSDGQGLQPGVASFLDLRDVKLGDIVSGTAQGIMDELRAMEFGANGDQL